MGAVERGQWTVRERCLQHVVPAGGALLAAGWYHLRLRLPAVEAGHSQLAPALCADYGWGFGPASRDCLLALRDGAGIEGVVRLTHPARGLQLELGVLAEAVDPEQIQLQRIGKGQAARRMLTALLRRNGARDGWLAALLRGGLRGLGDRLYADYLFHPDAGAQAYPLWADRHASLTTTELAQLRQRAAQANGPLISLLLPVYNTEPTLLRRCLDSVLAQTWPHWQLCVADDASPQPQARQILQDYAARDPRIQCVFRGENGHISAASNSALELARGPWLALLDHDDELAPHALQLVADTIAAQPQARMLYSDEDKLDAAGRRYDPYFKPDWNPDLFYGHNMFSHLGIYHAALVRAVGGFRRGFEGSQDYDLALRCSEQLQPEQIVHIPHVLYHWRAIPGSTALAKGEKNYAVAAGERALAEHLQRTGPVGARVELTDAGYRVRWPLPTPAPRISLIVPTRDRVDLLRTCVESVLARTDYDNFEIVIVDNQSREAATLAYLRELAARPQVRVLAHDAPFNYSEINNRAVETCDGELVCLLNNDIEVVDGDWLRELASQALRPQIGCVGAMLYYPDDTIQHAGVLLGMGGVANHICLGQPRGAIGQMGRARLVQNLSAVTAACLMVRRAVYAEVGGLDERMQVAFNDVDFCLRVRGLGYRNLWTPFAWLYHHESASRGTDEAPEKRARFVGEVELMLERWGEQLTNDPAYHPALALYGRDFELAEVPRNSLRQALGLD